MVLRWRSTQRRSAAQLLPGGQVELQAATFAAQRDELERRLEDADAEAEDLAADASELKRRLEDAEAEATRLAAQRDEQVARATRRLQSLQEVARGELEAKQELAHANVKLRHCQEMLSRTAAELARAKAEVEQPKTEAILDAIRGDDFSYVKLLCESARPALALNFDVPAPTVSDMCADTRALSGGATPASKPKNKSKNRSGPKAKYASK